MITYERSAMLCFDTHGCDVFRCSIKVGRIEAGVFKPQEGTMPQHASLVLADLRMAADALLKAHGCEVGE